MEAHELRPMPGNNCCQGQPPARKLVRYLREDQVRKKGHKVLDRTKALYGPRTQAYGETKYKNYLLQVLDRTKALYRPRTQAYGETKYKNFLLLQVLDRTKALYCPQTQAYGETKYKNSYYYKFWTEPRRYTFLGPKPTGKPTTRIRKGLNFARWAT